MVLIKGIPRSRRPIKKWVLLNFDDEFPWGAHKNRTVRWVLQRNPSYVNWCVITHDPALTMEFRFTKEVKAELERLKALPEYVEINPDEWYRENRPLNMVT